MSTSMAAPRNHLNPVFQPQPFSSTSAIAVRFSFAAGALQVADSTRAAERESRLQHLIGARYYCHELYRWISTDPVMSRDEAITSPQLWNLYAYCQNNPVTKLDPDGRELRTGSIATMRDIAGPAADRIQIVDGKVDVSGLEQSDIANNEGAALLHEMATSQHVYSYAEASTAETAGGAKPMLTGVENLDIMADSRWPGGKGPALLPPPGVDAAVTIDPNVQYVDYDTGTKSVSVVVVAFHELAEAHAKVDKGLPYGTQNGTPGAHAVAVEREKKLTSQRPGITEYPAGGDVTMKKREPH